MTNAELIDALSKYDPEEDVKLLFYFWDEERKKVMPQITNFTVSKWRPIFGGGIHLRAIMPKFEESSCMAGGHHENCQCHMGYEPKWRNK